MEISISNIAWDKNNDVKVKSLLKEKNIRFIDLAPTKYIKDIGGFLEKDVLKIKDYWNESGIKIYGMQSLLFGVKNLNIFSSEIQQNTMLEYLEKILRIGELLGSSKVVFGSPKNRDKKNLSDEIAFEVATKFFKKLSLLAETHNQIICLEPNPKKYSCNFMTSTKEAAEVVRSVDRNSIKLQLDTGTILINNEDIEIICKQFKDIISHIHISQPNLSPINFEKNKQIKIASVIKENFVNQVVTIEMLTNTYKDPINQISRSIDVVKQLY